MDKISIPHDIEAEQAILGKLLEENETLSSVIDILTPETFFKTAHQYIYRSILELEEKNIHFDAVSVSDALKRKDKINECGGYAYLDELLDCSPVEGDIRYYSICLQEHYQAREIIEWAVDISREARDPSVNIGELLTKADLRLSEISLISHRSPIVHLKVAIQEKFIQLEKLSEDPNNLPGIPTGFIDIDKFTSGLLPQNVITIAGRPGMGKTALGLNIATFVSRTHNVLVNSAEMGKAQIASRALTSEGKIEGSKMKTGNLEQEDWDKLAMATDRLSEAPFYIDDRTNDIDRMIFNAKRFYKKHGEFLWIIDYLQLLGAENQKYREQEVAYISRRTMGFAKEFYIPVVQLAQLNRALENRSDKRPQLSDLRESGALEQDSHIVIFIYRDEMYYENSPDKGVAEIIIAKHRDGPTGAFKLAYVPKYVKFVNLCHMRYDEK